MNIIQLNEIKHDVNNVFEFVTNKLNERYLNDWKEKKCSEYIRNVNCIFNNKKLSVTTWMSLNIKRNAVL